MRQAYEIIKQPVLVEDTSLGFTVLGGLPGPFVKFFVEAENGLEKSRMLDGFGDRGALASATYGYYDGATVRFFTGQLGGTIVDHPKGDGGYGWDKIFAPEGYDGMTRAELNAEDDLKTYNLIRDFDGLKAFLQSL